MAVLRIELEKKEKERTLNLTNVNIMKQLIGMAADHAGYSLKEELKPMLMQMGYEIKDFGTHSEESMDYPDVAHPLAEAVENGEGQ